MFVDKPVGLSTNIFKHTKFLARKVSLSGINNKNMQKKLTLYEEENHIKKEIPFLSLYRQFSLHIFIIHT